MDKAPHPQHLGDDGNATTKTGNAEDIIAKDPAKKLGKDPNEKNPTRTRTEQRAGDTTAKIIIGKMQKNKNRQQEAKGRRTTRRPRRGGGRKPQ